MTASQPKMALLVRTKNGFLDNDTFLFFFIQFFLVGPSPHSIKAFGCQVKEV
jgi:hypothetical protein